MAIKVKYARQCSETGELMNEGWVWGNGDWYNKYEGDVIKSLRDDLDAYITPGDDFELSYEILSHMSDKYLLDWACDNDILYFTEWEDEDDYQYGVDEDGNVVEMF